MSLALPVLEETALPLNSWCLDTPWAVVEAAEQLEKHYLKARMLVMSSGLQQLQASVVALAETPVTLAGLSQLQAVLAVFAVALHSLPAIELHALALELQVTRLPAHKRRTWAMTWPWPEGLRAFLVETL